MTHRSKPIAPANSRWNRTTSITIKTIAFSALIVGGWILSSPPPAPQSANAAALRVYDGPPRPSAQIQNIDGLGGPSYGTHAAAVQPIAAFPQWSEVTLCQALKPVVRRHAGNCACESCDAYAASFWNSCYTPSSDMFAQGEWIGPPRTQQVADYYIRVGDQIEFTYRRTRTISFEPYELNVGDTIRVESMTEEKLDRQLVIDPNGNITLPPAIQIRAAGRTVKDLAAELEETYKKLYRVPAITVTPILVETRLSALLESVDSRFGNGGLSQTATVTPEGTIQLPGIQSVSVNGLTISEVKKEIDARYSEIVMGIDVTPRLVAAAPRFVYVGGEVVNPNRYTLEAPTTVMQAINLAGGWNVGADLRKIVIFRRTENWQLIATTLDLQDAMLGNDNCPANEIFLRDSDIVLLPKTHLLLMDNFLDLVFTQGIYRVIPLTNSINFTGGSVLSL